MKLTFLINHWPPDVNPTGELMSQLAADLSHQGGHQVTVLTSFPHYEGFKVADDYKGRFWSRDRAPDVDVIRVWTYARGNKGMLPRLINYLLFNLAITIRGLFLGRPDVIFCPNGSFFTGLSGRFLALVKRTKYVYNVQDLYPDVAIRVGQLTNPIAIRILRSAARYMYRHAARVTVISDSIRKAVAAQGVDDERIEVIPNFVDSEFIKPLPRDNGFSGKAGLSHHFVIAYAGNLGHVYDFDTLFDAAVALADHPDIVLLLVGDGVERKRLEERAVTESLTNVRFMDFVPRKDLPLLRASSDVQIIPYRKGAAWGSMPSKVYEIMASARPAIVMAEADSDVGKLIVETRGGAQVDPGDSVELARTIMELYSDPILREELGTNGRVAAESRFSRRAVVDRYEQLFSELGAAKST